MSAKFKQTEIGLIPDDWEVKDIDSIATIETGSCNTQDKIDDGDFPFFVRSSIIERINSYSFDGEAVLTAGDGVGTGKVFHYINGKFDYHQRVYKISNFAKGVSGYFFYLYFSNFFYNRITQMTAKTSVDSVRREMISNMKIPIPPLPEQTAIVAALSDTDNYISSLEKLIEKKRLVKQGAMQDLLKPKKGWINKKLGDIAQIRDGTHQTPSYVEAGVPFYSVENVTNNDFINTKFISEEAHSILTKKYHIEKDNILMTRIGSIGVCKLVGWESNASFYVSLALLKINNEISPEYIYQYSKTKQFKIEILNHSLLNATPQKINLGNISLIDIKLPPKYDEQTAIATILSDMDNEITALEKKLAKAQLIKQGMLQQLLTGKIRLEGKS
ncbi:restriction modification system DNA specificity domain-containing protein [Spirochaetia bacterium]|nr:restriction modification system DNA specificity domain-containing protein [Spirochaetia bacterium]